MRKTQIIRHRVLFAFRIAKSNQVQKNIIFEFILTFLKDDVSVCNSFESKLDDLANIVYHLLFGSALGVFLCDKRISINAAKQIAKEALENWGYNSDWTNNALHSYFNKNKNIENILDWQKTCWGNYRESYKRFTPFSFIKTEEQFNALKKDIKSPDKLKAEMINVAKSFVRSGRMTKKQQDYISALEKL